MTTLAEIRSQYPQYGDMTDSALADALYGKFYSDVPREEFNAKIGASKGTTDVSAAKKEGFAPGTEEADFLAQANARPAPDTLKGRGSILPVGVTKEGEVTPALPEFIEGPRKTIMDLIEGRRTPQQITGKEMFELGALFAGGSAAGGTGAGIARSAATREAEALVPKRVEPPMTTPAAVVPEATPAAAVAPEVAARVAPEVAPKTTEEFRAAAKSFYKEADDSGVVIAPESFGPLVKDIAQSAAKKGLDPTLTPDSMAALKRLAEVKNEPLTFQTLDILRQIASDAKGAKRPSDRNIGSLIVEKLDDFVNQLGAKDVLSGDAKVLSEVVPKARDLWGRAARLETVSNLVDRAATSAAGFSGSGFENALRTEFRALAKNKKELRTFPAEEQNAIKKIARGGLVENVARAGGKFAPTGVVSTVLSGGAGAGVGGPIGAVALPAAGFVARQLATALTKRNVRALETLIREGDSKLATASIQRGTNLLERLGGGAAVASASAGSDRKKGR